MTDRSPAHDLQQEWQGLAANLVATDPDVAPGKMMSADALTFSGKVFAFFSTKGGRVGLGCRLGRNFDVSTLGLTDWQHLAPFKTRPPMKDWIVAGEGDLARWPALMRAALEVAQGRKN